MFDLSFNPLWTGSPEAGALANSDDPDEMPHNVSFHQGLHCLLKQNQSAERKIQHLWETIIYDLSI